MTGDLHHLAAAYALDAVDAHERAAFEAHYPACEICCEEVADYRATAARLATEHLMPPPALRGRVLDEIARTRQLPPLVPGRVVDLGRRRRRTTMLLTAVAAALVVIAGAVGFGLADRGADTSDDLVALLAAPDTDLRRFESETGAALSVAWSADRDTVAVFGAELPDPGPGLVYALWMLDDDGATPSLLFTPDSGAVEALGDLAGDPTGWGVTIEPEGGSPAPTGEILYLTEA